MSRRAAMLVMMVLLAAGSLSVEAQQSVPPTKPTVYVEPTDDGFEVYIAAAINKKKVPVLVVSDEASAMYRLRAARVEIEKVSTGSKVLSCLFAYCAGTEDKASTSVQLLKDGVVEWSYAVNKGRGSKNRQSMAEAIAKHLKNEYFRR